MDIEPLSLVTTYNDIGGNHSILTSNNPRQSTEFKAIQALLLICFMFAGLIGNLCVCVFMSRTRELRTRTNTFYVSLCIANIGIAVTSIPFSLSSTLTGGWALGITSCRINGIINPFWITASCFSVTATTIHKYLSITRPMKRHITRRKVYAMIFTVWLASGVISIWPIVHVKQIVYKPLAGHCGYSPSYHRHEVYYLIALACAVFLCPTLINSYCYVVMFRALNQHRLRIERSTIIDASGVKAQRRSAETILVVFVVFFITWLPFNIFSVLFASNREDLIPDWLLAVAYICAYSTCVQIPFVIIYRSTKLCNDFKRALCSTLCMGCPRASFIRQSVNRDGDPCRTELDRRCSAWYIAHESAVLRLEEEVEVNDTCTSWSYVNDNHVFDVSKL